MNEIFNFNRFWTYFKYDLKQMWRNHSKAAIMIGGASAIFYVIWVLASLVFTQHWSSPVIYARVGVFILAFAILELYMVRSYGYLTEKKAGSNWLMVPASKAEKFVSMLLMVCIVIPLLFFVVYFVIDGFLSLVDPTYGQALFTGFTAAYGKMIDALANVGAESPIAFTPSSMVFPAIVGVFCNFLYFLLCGICFKKNKLVGAIAILFGLSLVLSLLTGLIVPHFAANLNYDMDEMQIAALITRIANASVILTCLFTVGLGWGVWRRIKTIQH
ncbi:MAG: hypothetical protein II874_09855 [Bacteroidales bacterium]|nr:hypothetical protein [Bacteroidales bacterium]